jgi:hypothetical protein
MDTAAWCMNLNPKDRSCEAMFCIANLTRRSLELFPSVEMVTNHLEVLNRYTLEIELEEFEFNCSDYNCPYCFPCLHFSTMILAYSTMCNGYMYLNDVSGAEKSMLRCCNYISLKLAEIPKFSDGFKKMKHLILDSFQKLLQMRISSPGHIQKAIFNAAKTHLTILQKQDLTTSNLPTLKRLSQLIFIMESSTENLIRMGVFFSNSYDISSSLDDFVSSYYCFQTAILRETTLSDGVLEKYTWWTKLKTEHLNAFLKSKQPDPPKTIKRENNPAKNSKSNAKIAAPGLESNVRPQVSKVAAAKNKAPPPSGEKSISSVKSSKPTAAPSGDNAVLSKQSANSVKTSKPTAIPTSAPGGEAPPVSKQSATSAKPAKTAVNAKPVPNSKVESDKLPSNSKTMKPSLPNKQVEPNTDTTASSIAKPTNSCQGDSPEIKPKQGFENLETTTANPSKSFQARFELAMLVKKAKLPVAGIPELAVTETEVKSLITNLLREAIEINPKYHEAYIECGNLKVEMGHIEEAIEIYTKFPFSDKISQDDLYLHGEIARLLVKIQKFQHPNLVHSLSALGKMNGIKSIDSFIQKLDEKGLSSVLVEIFCKIHNKPKTDVNYINLARTFKFFQGQVLGIVQ